MNRLTQMLNSLHDMGERVGQTPVLPELPRETALC